jgi:sortase A
MKKYFSTILLILIFFVGLGLLLYPTLSDYINSLHQSKAISAYAESIENMDTEEYEAILSAARQYNATLAQSTQSYELTDEEEERYSQLLNVDGTGVMGYIEIPSIDISLPIYHGTSDSVLNSSIGHLDWTSLPVGGESTHCVLSGHRGLPSAKLFTNLDKLVVGDTFLLRTLDEVLTYEVDQILIVEPSDIEELQIVPGEDYCTLVTCTPYGINTHRLLVRGHRIENAEEAASVRVTSDAIQIEPVIVAPMIAVPILLILLMIVFLPGNKKKPSGGNKDEKTL